MTNFYKKTVALAVLSIMVCMSAFPQAMTISGGFAHGVVICSKGKVYAWGNNKDGKLGIGTATSPILKPTQVVLPAGLTFSQVTAGSGGHILALSCKNTVYAWGENENKEVSGSLGKVVTSPIAVPKGQTPGYNDDGTPGGQYLGNVVFVAACTNGSFALLKTGEVVAWGSGNWSDGSYLSPTYIYKEDGTRLTNVIHVAGGDNNALFVVDNGNGLGTLYSIGNWNGRGAESNAPAGAAAYRAAPVLREDTQQPLTNIRMSALADVGGFALDNEGYVWAWGNHSWGTMLGIEGYNSVKYANKVLSGEYGDISGEKYLTDVIDIIGGQGHAMFVTKEGYVLASGSTIKGISSTVDGPVLLSYCNGSGTAITTNKVKDAVKVGRGDTYGYMVNNKDQYFAIGDGSDGHLGINSITNYACFTPMAIPCDPIDVCPTAYMPAEAYKCPEKPIELHSGYITPIGKENRYYFSWYYNGTRLNTSTKQDAWNAYHGLAYVNNPAADPYNKTNPQVTKPGVYKVEIEYVGDNIPCSDCPMVTASITIRDKEMPIDTLVTTTCATVNPLASEQVCFKFRSKYAMESVFDVYSSENGGTKLNTITIPASGQKTGEFCVAGNMVGVEKSAVDTMFTIYLEDKTSEKGVLIPTAPSGGKAEYSPHNFEFQITAYEPILLTSFSVNVTATGGTLTPQIWSVGSGNGGAAAAGTLIWQGSAVNVTATGELVLPVGQILQGESVRGRSYFIKVARSGNNAVSLYTVSDVTSYRDNLSPHVLYANSRYMNSGTSTKEVLYYNFKFEKLSSYDCGRMKIKSRYYCPPCTQPTLSTASTITQAVCEGKSITNIVYTYGGGATGITTPTSTELKGMVTTVNPTAKTLTISGTPTASTTFTVSTTGTVSPCNAKTSTVSITVNPNPTATLSGGGEVCEGTTATAVTATISGGTADYTYSYTDNGTAKTGTTSTTATVPQTVPTAAGTYTYTLTSVKDSKNCETTFSPALSKTIVIQPKPTATIKASSAEYCTSEGGVTLELNKTAGIDFSGATYEWFKGGSSQAAASTSAASKLSATAGVWTCKITLNGCEYTTPAVTISENKNPEYTITGTGSYCPEATSKTPVEVTFKQGTAPYNFTINGTALTNQSSPYTIANPTGSAAGTHYNLSAITDSKGCAFVGTAPADVIVTDLPTPDLSIGTLQGFCDGDKTTVDISSAVTAGAGSVTYNIGNAAYGTASVGGTMSGSTLNVVQGTTGMYTVNVTITGTVSPFCAQTKQAQVEVWAKPSAAISAANMCEGNVLQLDVTPSGGSGVFTGGQSAYAWTVPGATLNSNTLKNPSIESITPANTYTAQVEVKDSRGCKTTDSKQVTIFVKPVVSLSADNNKFCEGVGSGNITASITPASAQGGIGVWANAAKVTETTATFNPTTATASPFTVTYNYTAPAASGSCTAEAKTITMTVNAKPQFSIAPSKASACKVDECNSEELITVAPTTPLSGGTFTYSSSDVAIDPSTGTFSTKNVSAGEKTITLEYTDGNNCVNTNTTTFTINDVPVVAFKSTTPTEVCYSTGTVELQVDITKSTTGTGTFSGTNNASHGAWTLPASGENFNFKYEYEDNTTQCKAQAMHSITVIRVDAPAEAKQSAMVTASNVLAASSTTDISVNLPTGAAGVDWFDSPATALKGSGATFATGVNNSNVMTYAPFPKTLQYITRAYKMVGANKCYSPDGAASLTITKCPAEQPTAKNPFFCVGDAATVTATATGSNVAWFSADVSASTDASPASKINDGTALSSGMTTAAAATKTFYVAAWAGAPDNCWSIATPVTITVKDKPQVAITAADANICAASEKGQFNLTPALPGGTLSEKTAVGGLNTTTGEWIPQLKTAQSSITALYTVKETWGSAATEEEATCENSAEATITAHFTPVPTTSNKTWALGNIAGIPAGHLVATVVAPGTKINWYKADKTTALTADNATGSAYTPNKSELQAAVNARPAAQQNDNYTETYYISQTDANGCESEKVQVTLTLVSCEFAQAQVQGVTLCEDGTLTNMTAAVPVTTLAIAGFDPATITWKWYNADRTLANSSNGNATANSTYKPATLPTVGATTTYYVEYEAEIPNSGGNTCKMEQAVTITVNALPHVAFGANPAQMCVGDAAITLEVSTSTTNTAGAHGVFSGATTSEIFNPSTVGNYSMTYTYTDGNACVNSATHAIEVIEIAAPIVSGDFDPKVLVRNTLGQLNGTTELQASANTEGDKVLWLDYATSAELDKDTYTYATGLTNTASAGKYPYWVQSYRTIDNGARTCYSEKVRASLSISDCPAQMPDAKNPFFCVNATNAVVAAATPATATLAWFTTDPVGAMGQNPVGFTKLQEGANYTSSPLTTAIAGIETVYVASYDAANDCWSAGKSVTLSVVPNPAVNIEVSNADFCAGKENVEIMLTPANAPANGTATLTPSITTGYNAAGKTWDASGIVNETISSAKNVFTYVVTETHGNILTDNQASCGTIKTAESTAHFMAKPTPEHKNWLIGDIANLPAHYMTASVSGTGKTIRWYADAAKTTEITVAVGANGLTMTPDKSALAANPAIIAAIAANQNYTYTYYITQSDGFGCESEAVAVNLELINCPFVAPLTQGSEVCASAVTASGIALSATTTETATAWHWYRADGTAIAGANTSSYSAGQTATYYVSYTAVETVSGKTCESPKAEVKLTVNANPVITAINSKAVYCNTEGDAALQATLTFDNTTLKKEEWKLQEIAGGINQYGVFTPSFNGETTATYTIEYTVTDNNDCKTTFTKPVDVQFTPPPATVNYEKAPNPSAVVEVKAINLEANASVQWYDNAALSGNPLFNNAGVLRTGDDPSPALPFAKSYWATQSVRGCESKPNEAKVIIHCLVPAPQVRNVLICNYYDYPELTAIAGNWAGRPTAAPEYRFYTTQTGSTPVETNNTGNYTPTSYNKNAEGDITFYVSEYNAGATPEGCESPRAQITVSVKKAPDSMNITPAQSAMCEYEANTTFSVANTVSGATIEWYAEQPAQSLTPGAAVLSSNAHYTPAKSLMSAPNTYTLYATQRVNYTNGTSSVACMSNPVHATLQINAQPQAPTLMPNESCFNETPKNLQAQGETGATIQWYKSATETAAQGNVYAPQHLSVANAGTYTFYATQTVNNCTSEKAHVQYTVKPRPAKPVVQGLQKVCDYDTDPAFTAIPATADALVKWYAPTANNYVSEGISVQTNRNVGTTYFATQTINGCEGAAAEYTFIITPFVQPPVTTSATMCQNAANIPSLRSNGGLSTDKWYYDAALINPITPNPGNAYTIPANERPDHSVTFYVQRTIEGCVSTPSAVTLTVVEIPTFTIGDNQTFCEYETIEVQAQDFAPLFEANSKVSWQLTQVDGRYNKSIADTDTHTLTFNTNNFPAAGEYALTALYYTKGCYSEAQSLSLTMHNRPNAPIVSSKIICQGTAMDALQAFGSPNIAWNFISGAQTLPDWTGETYDFNRFNLPQIAAGKYVFELFDTDAGTGCKSERSNLVFEVAPPAKTKIVGRTQLCEGTSLEEPYAVEELPQVQSNYYWKTSGSVYNFAKDGNLYSPNRYVDWAKTGIDTVYVYERTWAGCEGFDTLVVNIAKYPETYYTWTLPGASTTIELTDSSYQAPITSAYDNSIAPIELTYTMTWNFDKFPNSSKNNEDWFMNHEERFTPVTVHDYTYGYKYPTLTVTNEYGCASTYSTEIFVDIRAGVYMANAFSPTNAAESVRTFKPVGFNFESAKFSVYDKWGNLLYYSDEVQDGQFVGEWDGTYNGELLQSDVYIWKLEAKFLDGTTWAGQKNKLGGFAKYGNVTLIR
ncbi:MAG: hypothetical protein LBU90_09490 [Bacteroidales bacterium]|nr:hypothetical protein [Bacteroidales bacterium]